MSTAVTLTQAQQSRLRKLERDPVARVIGVINGSPVVEHSGTRRNADYVRMAIVSPDGRLRGIKRRAR